MEIILYSLLKIIAEDTNIVVRGLQKDGTWHGKPRLWPEGMTDDFGHYKVENITLDGYSNIEITVSE